MTGSRGRKPCKGRDTTDSRPQGRGTGRDTTDSRPQGRDTRDNRQHDSGASRPRRGHDSTDSRPQGCDTRDVRPHDSTASGPHRSHDTRDGLPHDSSASGPRRGHDTTDSRPRTGVRPLSPIDSRRLGKGYVGSSSNDGFADPLADMQGVLRRAGINLSDDDDDDESYHGDHSMPHSSNTAEMPHQLPHHLPQKPYITNIGTKFACGEIHRQIRRIIDQFFDGPWPTYTKVPKDVRTAMFDCFRTHYRWHPSNEGRIEKSFHRVVADRFPDIISELRKQSLAIARRKGHNINRNDFQRMREHVPWLVDDRVWQELCTFWDTPEWRRKSEVGRANRMSGDSTSKPRHTGGSMGYDEHRITLEKKLKRPIKFYELFLHTHLSKEAKKKFWAGDYETIGGLEFCTSTSREVYEAYERAMIERFGEDLTQHLVGDVDVWVDSQRGRGTGRGSRIYGIGCSDLHFVVTGTSSFGSASTSAEYEQSQRRVRELEERQAQLEAQMAERQSQYESQLEARMAKERTQLQARMAEERTQLQAQFKAQMEEFVRSYVRPPNNPPNPPN